MLVALVASCSHRIASRYATFAVFLKKTLSFRLVEHRRMGTGKQKSQQAQNKRKLAAKRRKDAKVIVNVEECDDHDEPITGRQKHQAKVEKKRKIREILSHKKTERLGIKKSVIVGDERAHRRSLCAEIKLLKEHMMQGEVYHESTTVDTADEY